MAYTLGALVTKVQQRVRDTGYSSTEIKNYINDAQRDAFNEYKFKFMEAIQDYTLTASDSDITSGNGLPTNYVYALDIMHTTDGKEAFLPYDETIVLDNTHPDADDTDINPAGAPSRWYEYADTIRVFPVPDDAYTIKLRYYKKPTEITSDDAVPEIPSEFEELLVSGAAYRVLQVKDNYDQAAIHQNKYDEILQKMVMKYARKQIGGASQVRINRLKLGRRLF